MLRQRARKVGHGREQHTFTKRARTGFRAMGASGFRECFFDPVSTAGPFETGLPSTHNPELGTAG